MAALIKIKAARLKLTGTDRPKPLRGSSGGLWLCCEARIARRSCIRFSRRWMATFGVVTPSHWAWRARSISRSLSRSLDSYSVIRIRLAGNTSDKQEQPILGPEW